MRNASFVPITHSLPTHTHTRTTAHQQTHRHTSAHVYHTLACMHRRTDSRCRQVDTNRSMQTACSHASFHASDTPMSLLPCIDHALLMLCCACTHVCACVCVCVGVMLHGCDVVWVERGRRNASFVPILTPYPHIHTNTAQHTNRRTDTRQHTSTTGSQA